MILDVLRKVWQEYLVIRVKCFELPPLCKYDTAIRLAASTGESAIAADEVIEESKAFRIPDDDNDD